MVSPANADCVRRDRPSRKDGKMQCWLQRNRVGTTDHILRQCLLRRSCCIRPLQRLHTVHKPPPNQRALCIRLQHRKKEKQQGRGRGGGISPALQITVCAAGNTKLLRHGLLSQCLLLPQRRQFFGKKLCEQRRVWFILKTSIVYNRSTMEILCRNEARFHEVRFVLAVQIL